MRICTFAPCPLAKRSIIRSGAGCSLAQRDEPVDAECYVGYPVDEELVSTWVEAVGRLHDAADAPLPNSAGILHQLASEVRRGASPSSQRSGWVA